MTLTIFVPRKNGKWVETDYILTYLHPAEEFAPAWRLTKLMNGKPSESYDIAVTQHGPTCTCADYNFCRQNEPKLCKHVESLRSRGLLRKDV